jgi:hypothetical protein
MGKLDSTCTVQPHQTPAARQLDALLLPEARVAERLHRAVAAQVD